MIKYTNFEISGTLLVNDQKASNTVLTITF